MGVPKRTLVDCSTLRKVELDSRYDPGKNVRQSHHDEEAVYIGSHVEIMHSLRCHAAVLVNLDQVLSSVCC